MTETGKISRIKQQIANLFDDRADTKWHRIVENTTLALILLSTLEVLLATFDVVEARASGLLSAIDIITTIYFTIEVSLRIWTIDLIEPKYKGFSGRVKYCLSFYGFIDFISTYPSFASLFLPFAVSSLKILRTLRLFRIFRYMESFGILKSAIKSKKGELSISLQFLVIITVILSVILYFVEHAAQPEVYNNGLNSVIWAFAKYVQDPGGFADYAPVTFIGKLISFIIGILGIAIVAVPTGFISSGFVEAIEENQKGKVVREDINNIHKAFERKQDRLTGYQIAPVNVSVIDIKAKLQIPEDRIFEAVGQSEDMRIINLSTSVPDRNAPDKLLVEHFFVNRSYGCCIDRGSKVTIISTSSLVEPSIGHFSYWLAKMGGFNYISRECGEVYPYKSFYIPPTDIDDPNFADFIADVNSFAKSPDNWLITLSSASGGDEPDYPTEVHITYGAEKGDDTFNDPNILIHDTATAGALFTDIEDTLLKEFGLHTDRQKYHKNSSPKIFLRRIEHKDVVNSFVIKVAYKCTTHSQKRVFLGKTLADLFNRHLEPAKPAIDETELMTKDIGYIGYSDQEA